MTKKELEDKVEILKEKVDEIMEQSFNMKDGWKWFQNHPTTKEYWRTLAEYRLVQDYTLRPFDKSCGSHMKLEEFICAAGTFFSDYDGSGYYATENEISNIACIPSDICNGYVRKDFTHVVWYNK